MDQEIRDKLYESAGIDITSLEHRCRLRWNGLSPEERGTRLNLVGCDESWMNYRSRRWDALPKFVRDRLTSLAGDKTESKIHMSNADLLKARELDHDQSDKNA